MFADAGEGLLYCNWLLTGVRHYVHIVTYIFYKLASTYNTNNINLSLVSSNFIMYYSSMIICLFLK